MVGEVIGLRATEERDCGGGRVPSSAGIGSEWKVFVKSNYDAVISFVQISTSKT